MPNYTSNELTVWGEASEVAKFREQIGDEIDFEKIIPMPENCFRGNLGKTEREQCAADGVPNWYDWCSENWGTKWNACSPCPVVVEKYPASEHVGLSYRFDTAWDAPRPVISALKKQWPDLEIAGGYVHEGYEGCASYVEIE